MADPGDLESKCKASLDFFGLFDDPIGEMVGLVAKLFINAAFGVLQAVLDIDSQNQGVSAQISGQVRWIVVYLSVGSILFSAAKMALDRRAESGQTALKGIMRVLLVSTLASTLVNTFTILMDRYTEHLLEGAFEALRDKIDCADALPNMLMLVVGCLLLIAGIIHALLMWIRLGVMILLMGTLPLAASASMTDWGTTWWRKHIGWMTAWLLYKPTVGLVIWSGATMVNATTTGEGEVKQVNTQIAGMGILLLSAVCLPALMRIIVPATEALGQSDGVGKATTGVVGGIASGAKAVGGGAMTVATRGLAGGGAAAKGGAASGASGSGSGGSSGGGGGSGVRSGQSAGGGQGGGGSGAGSQGGQGPQGSQGGGGSQGSRGAQGSQGGQGRQGNQGGGGQGPLSGGGGGGSPGGGSSGGGGTAASGARAAATRALPIVGAVAGVAGHVAHKTVKGALNVAQSGVEGANGTNGTDGPSGARNRGG
ncbi:hypothetical protein GCM10009801_12360 [Streptomyces albiaxialis]|uniref:TrbL/VirB6 plasmid conjugal transfer protein n=1 Tax=Streptomyces albiaxialis TaxID=329523 RepID=A0ABN2VRZ7_9ACTN